MSVLVAGNSVLDIHSNVDAESTAFADGWASQNVSFLDRAPSLVLGGNGAATAYTLGRLGVPVLLNTALGQDDAASMVRHWLTAANVQLAGAPAKDTAVNIVKTRSSDGARQSTFYTGSKLQWHIGIEDEHVDWFFASGYGQVDASDFEVLSDALSDVNHRGVRVALDPGPWFARCVDTTRMRETLPSVEVLSGTFEELAVWSTGETPEDIIDDYLDLGVAVVVVKRGPEGAQYGDCDSRGVVRGEPISSAHAVGAGDTFNGALLAGLVTAQASLEEIVRDSVRLAEQAVRSGRGVLGAFEGRDSADSV